MYFTLLLLMSDEPLFSPCASLAHPMQTVNKVSSLFFADFSVSLDPEVLMLSRAPSYLPVILCDLIFSVFVFFLSHKILFQDREAGRGGRGERLLGETEVIGSFFLRVCCFILTFSVVVVAHADAECIGKSPGNRLRGRRLESRQAGNPIKRER